MPEAYTICLDPSIPPVQHARRRVPIKCRGAPKKIVVQQIISTVTEPMEWVSSLTYPQSLMDPLYMP